MKSTIANHLSDSASTASLAHIPACWEDESLYGWCTRLQVLTGARNVTLGMMLFGRPHASRSTDIPQGLGKFVLTTKGLLGGPQDILLQRTVAAAYWPFLSDHARSRVLAAATDQLAAPATQLLGMNASNVGAQHPLRSCSLCRAEAMRACGYATWLLKHQFPGVWWCVEHQKALEQVPGRSARWIKPGQADVALGEPQNAKEAHALEMMVVLSRSLRGTDRADTACMAKSVVRRLQHLGLASSVAKLNIARLSVWLEEQPILQWIRRQGKAVKFPSGNWATPMLRGRALQHPLLWMVFWTALWGDESIDRAEEAFKDAVAGRCLCESGDQLWLFTPFMSDISKVALPDSLVRIYSEGQNVGHVARALGVSELAVQAWIDQHPDFSLSWIGRNRAKRLQSAKANIECAIASYPRISASQIEHQFKREIAWLRSNAPRTLQNLLDSLSNRLDDQQRLF